MKKFFSHVCGTLAVLCGLYLLAPQVGLAQTDCPPDFNNGPNTINIPDPSCPGCFFTVTYCFRCSGPGGSTTEIFIGDITRPAVCDLGITVTPCPISYAPSYIAGLAFKKIVDITGVLCTEQIPPCSTGTANIVRFLPGSCRTAFVYNTATGQYESTICSTLSCWGEYKVCWKMVNNVLVKQYTLVVEGTDPATCSGGSPQNPCQVDCPSFMLLND